MDVMIDLETLSVTPESVLLTLAAVKFNPHNKVGITDELYHKLNVDEQIAQGYVLTCIGHPVTDDVVIEF